MDRRSFIATTLASVAFCGCSRQAAADDSESVGCSLTAAGLTKVQQNMKPSGGVGLAGIEKEIFSNVLTLRQRYGLRPGAVFFDDSKSPNAYADPKVLVPDGEWGGKDGTLLLGETLFFEQFRNSATDILNRAPHEQHVQDKHALDAFVILAHEFGHILQFKNGFRPLTFWQLEPHADFMAGWAIDKNWVNALFGDKEESFENAVRLMFSIGDTAFDDPKHHGEPQFRAAMVQAGQDAHDLPMQAAFEKGAKLVGLKI